MGPPMTQDDKINFLLTVVRNAEKVDMHAVAEELDLKFDTARMRLKYITQGAEKDKAKAKGSGGGAEDDGELGTPKKGTPKKKAGGGTPRKKAGTPASAKKVKMENGMSKDVGIGGGGGDDDGDEMEEKFKPIPKANGGRKRSRAVSQVNYNEESDANGASDVNGKGTYANGNGVNGNGAEDSEGQGFYDFDDFAPKGEDEV